MRPTNLRPVALTSSLLSLAAQSLFTSPCQAQTPATTTLDPKAKPPAAGSQQGSDTVPADDVTAGLPKFLQLVPGGKVEVGITADELADAACQVVFPDRPEMALKISEEKVKTALRRSMSLLGQQSVQVEPFLLGKWNVKNIEYETYVNAMRGLQKKVRAPFHWWRFGRADDYNAKLEEINKQFPKDKFGPLNYWDRYGDTLPFKVANEKGESIGDYPVTYVSWAEANAFAGWLGMRLPTEYEWLRAARGDGKNLWPCGQEAYTSQLLKMLQQDNSRNQMIKPTGTVQAAAGPFGHIDMYGQVWQFVADLGYDAINGKDPFVAEWKKAQKHKIASLVESPPVWKGNLALAKGGSYLSFQEPIQLMLDTRAPVGTIDVLESLGFRLAKSLRPGYDMMFSLLRGVYNRSLFEEGQDIDLNLQIGAERYELGKDGFPTAYHAVSFAPVAWLTNDKSQDLNKLLERSQTTPLLIGTLTTTANLVDPAVPAGIYSMLFRREGMPRDLTDAIKVGFKEVQAEKKRRAKAGDKADKKEDDKKDDDKGARKGSWQEVLPRYGLTEKDLEDAEHATDIKFVRIDGIQVSTETDVFLVHGIEGKILAVIEGTKKKPAQGNPFAPEISVTADAKGLAKVLLRIGTPVQLQNPKRFVDIQLPLTLDTPAPTAEKPWRIQGQ
ncbi:MAG: SUMF1/EgtB/PvdO family nonheme iron enzyme [Planctomycetes bacterium]|nr:SUMF1/EgtB/PvdO family nonheme iron enzyme [Planctomycetota bacterium]